MLMAIVHLANDIESIQEKVDNFSPTGFVPSTCPINKKMKKYHNDNFEKSLLRSGYTFIGGRYVRGIN
jgi:hypothetical protein